MAIVTPYQARPYRPNALGSLSRTAGMLLRQHEFPERYDTEKDRMIQADSDRLLSWDYSHSRRCYQQHLGTGEGAIERWIKSTTDAKAMAFIVDVLKAEETYPGENWTGYRVLGGVHQGNGFPIWSYYLFANHSGAPIARNPVSDTVITASEWDRF